jgi:hypothetical protein
MGMSAGPKGGIKSDINVTPLVDVVARHLGGGAHSSHAA